MNILFIADIFPYPAISGGKIRILNLLKQLSKYNCIDFICLNDKIPTKLNIKEFKNICKNAEFCIFEKKTILHKIINIGIKFKSNKLDYHFSLEFTKLVRKKLEKNMILFS